MIPRQHTDLMNDFKNARLHIQSEDTPKKKQRTHVPPRNQRKEVSPYQTFLSKFSDLEENIENFKTRDFVYYFREVAERSGYKYTISNIKKDMAIMKRLTENYTNTEICGMIEFLYKSEQDYLDKERLSPNILASQWVNTIYADMKLWVNDEYLPKSKKKHKKNEWTAPVEDNNASSIGEW